MKTALLVALAAILSFASFADSPRYVTTTCKLNFHSSNYFTGTNDIIIPEGQTGELVTKITYDPFRVEVISEGHTFGNAVVGTIVYAWYFRNLRRSGCP